MRRAPLLLLVALAVLVAAPSAASAKDPGRWIVTGATSVPNDYFQGLTSNPADTSVYFTGFFQGLWKTSPRLSRVAGVPVAIPPAVVAAEGYNHIGDPTWAKGEGGRVILPLECYSPRLGQHLRHRRVRGGRPGHAGLPLLREARPGGDPEGHVGRDLARRQADLDEQRQRPAGLPDERRDGGERVARPRPDPCGAQAAERGAALGHHRRGVRARAAAAGRRGRDATRSGP